MTDATTGTTAVDIQGMIGAQGSFQSALDHVNTAYSDMTEQQSVLAANWSGEAASNFGAALTQYLEDLGTVKTQLTGILEKLSSNTGVYANTNEGSTQLANVFKTGLPGLTGI
jgi:WXG100 family type VII secretion target